jgi:ribosome-associated toxin RatA of RatAB toxin-antitoxin module
MLALFAAPYLVLSTTARAADPDQPHDHTGVLTPYKGTPPQVELTDEDLERLGKGKLVMKPMQDSDTGGRGLAVQDIHAGTDVVWSRIVAYDRYPEWVNYVSECEIYEQSGDHIKARFVLKGFGFEYEYYIDHIYRPSENYMTWTLDYSRQSDLNDSVGYWYVAPHPDKAGWSRVYYSVDVQVKQNMPGFIADIATRTGLKEATSWVREQSELAAGN